ncbi:nucleoporin Nup120/160-domain-containing protein [Dipodascopsis tothii]|uniref:nucleoporin Nup120/160-domain-containing protein n=1 Tax=Dipodascopsis tothii TaxID=44089 RepID=UPI0034CEEEA9
MPRDPSKYLCESFIRVDTSSLRQPVVDLEALAGDGGRDGASRFRGRESAPRDADESYTRRHIASGSGIFYRDAACVGPRAILWRIVEDGRVLTLTPVDVAASDAAGSAAGGRGTAAGADAHTLRVRFGQRIKPGCVVLSDRVADDVLAVDVLTETHTLYSCALGGRDFVGDWPARPQAEWCRVSAPSVLGVREPLFFIALSTGALVFALLDGGLLLLQRTHPLADDAKQKMFSDGSYYLALSRMLPWSSSDRVKGHPHVSVNLTVSMVADVQAGVLFTATVNSTVKVWSLETLVPLKVFAVDADRAGMRPTLDIAPASLLSLAPGAANSGHVGFYSPVADGQFRLWGYAVRADADGAPALDLVDVTREPVVPTAPNENSIWMVTDFVLEPAGDRRLNLWVMWKSNKSARVHVLLDIAAGARARDLTWRAVVPAAVGELAAPVAHGPAADVSARYAAAIFQLGVFSPAIIRTVLPIFERHYAVPGADPGADDPLDDSVVALRARVCAAVEATVAPAADADADAYWRDLLKQWQRFERLCLELSNQGNEALALCRDPASAEVSVVRATSIGPVRTCVDLEYADLTSPAVQSAFNIVQRNNKLTELYAQRADTALLNALASFRKSLSHAVLDDFVRALNDDMVARPEFSVEDRIYALYEAALGDQLSDAAVGLLLKRLSVIDSLDEVLVYCFSVFQEHTIEPRPAPAAAGAPATAFTGVGVDLMAISVAKVAASTYHAVTDILIFIVLCTCDDAGRFPPVDGLAMYVRFARLFRSYALLNRMAATTMTDPRNLYAGADDDALAAGVGQLGVSAPTDTGSFAPGGSLLQFIFHHFGASFGRACAAVLRASDGPLALGHAVEFAIAYWSLYEKQTPVAAIICAMLAEKYVVQARTLLEFLPQSPFGEYVTARVRVQAGDFDAAVAAFSKASAHLMFDSFSRREVDALAGLVPAADRAAFSSGYVPFLAHAGAVLARAGAFQHAHDLVARALNAAGAPDQAVCAQAFDYALRGALFDEAYEDLVAMPDRPAQLRALADLVRAMCEAGRAARLCELPFLELQRDVERVLEDRAHATTDITAKPNYYKVLYAWRIEHENYREAAAIIYEYIQRLRNAISASSDDFQDSDIVINDNYLVLLNTLACIDDDALPPCILARQYEQTQGGSESPTKRTRRLEPVLRSRRVLVKLEDVEHEYSNEIERMRIMLGRKLLAI